MPHKKQKKSINTLHDGSSPKGTKPETLAESPIAGPTVGSTNYREIHQDEAEALRSIYGEDFQHVELRQAAWKVCQKILLAIFEAPNLTIVFRKHLKWHSSFG